MKILNSDYRAIAKVIADQRPDPYAYTEAAQNTNAALDEVSRGLAQIFKEEDVLFGTSTFLEWAGVQ